MWHVYLINGTNENEARRILINLGMYPRISYFATDSFQRVIRTQTDIMDALGPLVITEWTEQMAPRY